jgi:hypothetical protein
MDQLCQTRGPQTQESHIDSIYLDLKCILEICKSTDTR